QARSICAEAARGRARPHCWTRRRRSRASTPSRCPAARHSASIPPRGYRRGSRNRAAASPWARRAYQSCRRPFYLTSITAATRTGRFPPYRELGYAAATRAAAVFALGSVGAGAGATTVSCKGGLGSASAQSSEGPIVGALAAVNAAGSVLVGSGPWFWAAPFDQNGESGGRGWPDPLPANALEVRTKG